MAQPDALLAQLGGAEPGAGEDIESESISDGTESEDLEILMSEFDDASLPVEDRLAALRAALGL